MQNRTQFLNRRDFSALLDKLEVIDREATASDWNTQNFDDTSSMSSLVVTHGFEGDEDQISFRNGNWPVEKVVCAFLIQEPPYILNIEKAEINSELVCQVRNNLSGLIFWARKGLMSDA